ncbi:MAG: twin-arginine translocase TatA/TatE family subunit [Opitutaceae bacterium]|nr:twin-arginine translocase TatA/TatE family subunit [Cytophagales bacterium]
MLTNIFLFMGMGAGEITLVMFAMLLLFGAKKIPELAKGLGKGIKEFKDASSEVTKEMNAVTVPVEKQA